jgi:hypothetical protein
VNLARRLFALTLPYAPLARRLLPLAALATLLGIGLQFVFAGMGVFGATFAGVRGFDFHFWMGGVIHALLGLVLALAIVGRQPRALIAINGALFAVATVMMGLPRLTTVELRAMHPLGALFVFWLTYVVYQRARAAQFATASESESADVPETAPAFNPAS